MSARPALIAPRLLTRQQAAAYCNVSIGVFSITCPVRPVSLGNGSRYDRFDVQLLDQWIDRLTGKTDDSPTRADWLERL